jgi:hypothetical protein
MNLASQLQHICLWLCIKAKWLPKRAWTFISIHLKLVHMAG